MTVAEFAEAVHKFVAANWPGRLAARVLIQLHETAEPISLPVPPPRPAAVSAAGATPKGPQDVWIPTDYQAAILEALEFRALHTDALVAAVGGDRRRLFRRPGGIHELRDHGLVALHRQLGYYRPDAPPAELAAEDEDGD